MEGEVWDLGSGRRVLSLCLAVSQHTPPPRNHAQSSNRSNWSYVELEAVFVQSCRVVSATKCSGFALDGNLKSEAKAAFPSFAWPQSVFFVI